jgi:hypothetical protein
MNFKAVFVSFCCFSSILSANTVDLSFDINENSYKAYKDMLVKKNINTNEDVIKKSYERQNVFVRDYIKKNGLDKYEIELLVSNHIHQKYLSSILSGISVGEDIIKSYYDANKNNFKKAKSYDVYIIDGLTKEMALTLKKELSSSNIYNELKKRGFNRYQNLSIVNIPSIYKFHLENMKKDILSEAIELESGYSLILYSNIYPEGYQTYDTVKGQIREFLVNKKSQEYIDAKYEEIKSAK